MLKYQDFFAREALWGSTLASVSLHRRHKIDPFCTMNHDSCRIYQYINISIYQYANISRFLRARGPLGECIAPIKSTLLAFMIHAA